MSDVDKRHTGNAQPLQFSNFAWIGLKFINKKAVLSHLCECFNLDPVLGQDIKMKSLEILHRAPPYVSS